MTLDRLSWIVFLIAVGAAPIMFGGNVPLGWSLSALLSGLSLFCLSIGLAFDGKQLPVPLRQVALPAVLMTMVLLIAGLQITSFVPDVWKHPLWHEAASVLDIEFTGFVSLSRSATIEAIWITLTITAAYWLGLQHGRNPERARSLVQAIAICAAVNALYGLFEVVIGRNNVLWFSNVAFKGRATGSFINPNHFAAYLSIGFACAFTCCVTVVQSDSALQRYSGLQKFAAFGLAIISAGARFGSMLLLIAAGVALSGSRAGFAFLVIIAAVVVFILVLRSKAQSRGVLLVVGLSVLLALLVGMLMAGDTLDRRLAGVGSDDSVNSRLLMNTYALRIIADNPWLGFGYGAFEQVFPMYRDANLPWATTMNAMHNSYLEAAIGLGVPGAIMLVSACGWILVRCAIGAVRRRRDALAPIAATASMLVIALHALVDFSIQIQGIAYVLAALAGAATAQTWSSREPQIKSGGARSSTPFAQRD
jgi:O-antigen ligase